MDNKYHLEVLTPHRKFYDGDVEEIIVTTSVGEVGVQKGHIPMTVALGIGTLKIKNDNVWKEASISNGFMEVKQDNVVILADAAEWPEEIDIMRAEAAKQRAEERLRQKKSQHEYLLAKAALKRALVRMSVAKKYKNI
ncbi:F0F1 ATP synthase subunit epsilon [Thermoanaerobacterium thermosaccharolyticum]|jgi:F-type H+-transporting ATPase subunit epsilon|uniref:ATP synthase epsilon chain n=1 Tax=Thermoanaerobacterium thermosaccharolyticum (strain ATCC 7956 / DSM 571 / NCIMB 9385 / NCA 3814 / NCTC 13789 / WDCM 00135 / 2032) TaxID=580327 RepID=D9TME6_THETC|nr:F0F1 ATP synthase subunit epsilon [Thermoanaerobacterium thermosaccharolyticum]ADL68434.1 ATP synthase F1, epsilon subunit [Thermoanaerobacterium thermosaccharolyticum DSM 571]KAA5808240.1 F0F1 ATP synthase subunit epsilon [Thermoanaerobacterium thermosaccharolyticum]MBE0070024.1 F0F1 ATP synthase subunit epsilon [Thermoanaerobacterium thermosaccharolyticum]MBE0227606.1 F0F1 ATP synthase subunit epsilon [Thermoanaerobacterium thermosaccharolyticum]